MDNHPTEFIGYDELSANSTVIGLLHDGATVNEVATGQEVEVILDASTFYAESGGQIGDRGQLVMGDTLLTVNDVQKIGKKLWVHRATVETGGLNVGDVVTAAVDPTWRHAARQAHSATHLIHAALREVLGPTAVQAGSMNKPGYLRFDFNYTEALTPKQLQQIEEITNQAVDSDWVVNTIETTLEEAKAMGAMALFGENYDNVVRVVEIGGPFSMELCGGTHVSHSSQIGPVAVLGEASIGSGARRIEAYSGLDSFRYLSKERALVAGLASSLKAPSEEVPERVAQLAAKLKEAERQIADFKRAQLLAESAKLAAAVEVGDFKVAAVQLPDGTAASDLRIIATDIRNKFGDVPGVVVLGSKDGDKVPFVVAVTAAGVARGVKAGELVKTLNQYINGRGGGKPDMAQGSGTNVEGLATAFRAVSDILEKA